MGVVISLYILIYFFQYFLLLLWWQFSKLQAKFWAELQQCQYILYKKKNITYTSAALLYILCMYICLYVCVFLYAFTTFQMWTLVFCHKTIVSLLKKISNNSIALLQLTSVYAIRVSKLICCYAQHTHTHIYKHKVAACIYGR